MTRRKGILTGFSLVVALLILISGVSYWNLEELIAAQNREEEAFQMRYSLSRVVALLVDAETSQRGYVITGNESFLEPYTETLRDLPAELATVHRLARRDASTQAQIQHLDHLVRLKLSVIETNIAARRDRGEEFAEQQVKTGKGKRIMDEVRAHVSVMDREEAQRLTLLNDHLGRAGSRAFVIIVVGSALAILSAAVSLDQVRRAFLQKEAARREIARANELLEERVLERTARLNDALAQLKLENVQRERLEAELLRVSEDEQRRIAQDLHDGLGQILAGGLHLSAALQNALVAEKSPQASEAENLRHLLKDALEQARLTARGLYPVKDIPRGLALGLKDLARQAGGLFQVDCQFLGRGEVLVANNEVATHLYRIAQEAINNAAKHGGASRVEIDLNAQDGKLILEVRDNGKGLHANAGAKEGLGLQIMRHRAEMIGGVFSLARSDASGVVARCVVSLEKANKSANEKVG